MWNKIVWVVLVAWLNAFITAKGDRGKKYFLTGNKDAASILEKNSYAPFILLNQQNCLKLVKK